MIPHEYIEELNRRTDIVDLVGSYVQLKRKGRLYGGLCPFHSEIILFEFKIIFI